MATHASSSPQAAGAPAVSSLAATDIRDIKPPVPIPDWSWLFWALAVALLAALAGWWWRRRRAKPATVAVAPEELIPPHVRARARLADALELITDPQPFCFAVSDALRWYLEEQFELRAPERTTEEFLDELQGSPHLELEQKRLLADFLIRCDLIKFARHRPDEPALRALHQAALRLVIETEPSRVPAAVPETAARPEAASTAA